MHIVSPIKSKCLLYSRNVFAGLMPGGAIKVISPVLIIKRGRRRTSFFLSKPISFGLCCNVFSALMSGYFSPPVFSIHVSIGVRSAWDWGE